MSRPEIRHLPENFLFGSAVAPFQVEGNYDGSRRTDWDEFIAAHPEKEVIRPGEQELDWWGGDEARQDLTQMKALGFNAQRLGIEWDRVMPEKGKFSSEAIKRYRTLINYLHELELTPAVTLNHFVLPAWVAHEGGWASRTTKDAFRDYAKLLADNFGDVPYWITVNEPTNTAGLGYLKGIWPPEKKNPLTTMVAMHQLVQAHETAYQTLKLGHPEAQIGAANTMMWLRPDRPDNVFDRTLTRVMNYLYNTRFISQTLDHSDFIGVNYYTGYYLRFNPLNSRVRTRPNHLGVVGVHSIPQGDVIYPNAPANDLGWPIVPEFFLDSLTYLHQTFHKPIMITENGVADRYDRYRALYGLTHLVALHEAINRGVDIRGYFHWSTVDNLEWLEGFRYQFGLIAYDPLTRNRQLRRSARLYQEIATSKTIDVASLSERYLTPADQEFLGRFLNKITPAA